MLRRASACQRRCLLCCRCRGEGGDSEGMWVRLGYRMRETNAAVTPPNSPALAEPSLRVVISALGVTQILAWGTSYYLPAVLAKPISADTGWPLTWVVGGLSLGLV